MRQKRTGGFGETPPAWMEALRDRSGPMLPAAQRFAREHGEDPFPSGHDGIKRLASLVEKAAYDPDLGDDDDARFVEGAGAMLGMLLLGHVGLGRHRERGGEHRIELGERGFFDPFGAIDASLDADRPMAELQRRIAAAEAEAAGDGPVARTTSAFAEALERSGIAFTVKSSFGPFIELDDGIEVDLSRFVSMAGDDAADLNGNISRLVGMLGARSAAAYTPYADVEPRLLPRIAPTRFFTELDTDPARSALARRRLSMDLHVALVVAADGRLRFVREDELERWRQDGNDPYADALSRLDARARDTRFQPMRVGDSEGLYATRADGLAATLVLAPSFHLALTRRFPDGCVVAMPHRDELVAFPSEVDLASLREHVAEKKRRAPHGISDRLFSLKSDGTLEPLD